MQQTLTTTISLLWKHDACESGYEKLVKSLPEDYPDDAPINLLRILDSNGVADMLWALRATREDSKRIGVLMAADMAEHVLPIFERYNTDPAPRRAIAAARGWVAGKITVAQLRIAAAHAIDAATHADETATHAAYSANCAAHAVDDVIDAVEAGAHAARAAHAGDTADDVAEWQTSVIRKYLTE